MAFELEIDEAGGSFRMKLTEVPASIVEDISGLFAQSANLVALYADTSIIESQFDGLTPDTPVFRTVAQGLLRAKAHLHLASQACKAANDVLTGKAEIENHPLLFDDE